MSSAEEEGVRADLIALLVGGRGGRQRVRKQLNSTRCHISRYIFGSNRPFLDFASVHTF